MKQPFPKEGEENVTLVDYVHMTCIQNRRWRQFTKQEETAYNDSLRKKPKKKSADEAV